MDSAKLCGSDEPLGDLEREIIRIVAEVCWATPDSVALDRDLVEYGLDSARAVDLLVALEEAFAVDIPDDVAARLRTVADIARFVREEIRR